MIPVTNNTAMPIYVGAEMVPAGETRLFHEWLVPEHLKPQEAVAEAPAEEVQPPDAVAELSEKSAKDVIAAIEGLTDQQLERLGDLEQARGDRVRTTVLAAIAEANLKRAEAKAAGGT